MKEYYVIRFPEKITSRYFYKELLPEVNKYICSNKKERIIFDWGMVHFINSLVIPNLLMLGHQIRVRCGESAKIFIPTKTELLNYLYEINFLIFSKRFYIYDFYDEFIGDYELKNTIYKKTYYLESGCSDEKIWRMLDLSDMVIEEAYGSQFDIINGGRAFSVKKSLWEMCKNSISHGNSFAFLTIQKEVGINKVMISAADTGGGIYKSLLEEKILIRDGKGKKDEYNICETEQLHFMTNRTFYELRNSEDREVYAILEAAFFRREEMGEGLYGLWDIIKGTLEKDNKGVVRIHSNNIQVIFTNDFLEKNFNNEILPEICIKNKDNNSKGNSTRRNSKFFALVDQIKKTYNVNMSPVMYRGVHIEIEVRVK